MQLILPTVRGARREQKNVFNLKVCPSRISLSLSLSLVYEARFQLSFAGKPSGWSGLILDACPTLCPPSAVGSEAGSVVSATSRQNTLAAH